MINRCQDKNKLFILKMLEKMTDLVTRVYPNDSKHTLKIKHQQ